MSVRHSLTDPDRAPLARFPHRGSRRDPPRKDAGRPRPPLCRPGLTSLRLERAYRRIAASRCASSSRNMRDDGCLPEANAASVIFCRSRFMGLPTEATSIAPARATPEFEFTEKWVASWVMLLERTRAGGDMPSFTRADGEVTRRTADAVAVTILLVTLTAAALDGPRRRLARSCVVYASEPSAGIHVCPSSSRGRKRTPDRALQLLPSLRQPRERPR